MSLDTSIDAIDYLIVVRLYTTYPTTFLGLCTEYYYDGTHAYEGRLLSSSLGSLREEFPRAFEARLPLPEMTIEISNGDGRYTSDMEDNNHFAGRVVEIYCIARGDAVTYSDLIFKGTVDFPGGVEYDADKIKIHVTDFRKAWDAIIPADTITEELYPTYSIPDESKDKPVPAIYGDWYNDVSSDPWEGHPIGVECIAIDTGLDEDGNQVRNVVFLVGRPVTRLWLIDVDTDGVAVVNESKDTPDTVYLRTAINADLTEGTFEIDKDDYTYDEADRVFVRAIGEMDDAQSRVITNPAEIIRHLLIRYTTADSGDFDTVSYTLAYNYFHDGARKIDMACRRHIRDEVDLWEEIGGLCFECGIDLYNLSGKIAISVYNPYGMTLALVPDITESDVVQYKAGGFMARVDPDEVYCTRVVGKYLYYSPARSGGDVFKYTESISRTGIGDEQVKRVIEFKWIYRRAGVEWRIARISFMFGGVVIVYEMKITNRALKWNLTRRVTVSLAAQGLTLRDVQVRAIDKNLQTGVSTVTGWDVYVRSDAGRWTPPGVSVYTDATADEKKRYGYWTDGDGLCDPGDPNSALSKWT
jgi:hypothetical protein